MSAGATGADPEQPQRARVTTDMISRMLDPDAHRADSSSPLERALRVNPTAAKINATFTNSGHHWKPEEQDVQRGRHASTPHDPSRFIGLRAAQKQSVRGLGSAASGVYHSTDLTKDSFESDDVDSVLSQRLKQHEELMRQHRQALDRQKSWLSSALGHRSFASGRSENRPSSNPESPGRAGAGAFPDGQRSPSPSERRMASLRDGLFFTPPPKPEVQDPVYTSMNFDPVMVSPSTMHSRSNVEQSGVSDGDGEPTPLHFRAPTQSSLRKRSDSTAAPQKMLGNTGVGMSGQLSPARKSVSIRVDPHRADRSASAPDTEAGHNDTEHATAAPGQRGRASTLPPDSRLLKQTDSSALRRAQTQPNMAGGASAAPAASLDVSREEQAELHRAASMLDGRGGTPTTSRNASPATTRGRTPGPASQPSSRGASIAGSSRNASPNPRDRRGGGGVGAAALPKKSSSRPRTPGPSGTAPKYHARRMAEIEAAKEAAEGDELRELTFAPRISGNSERLAGRARARQGVDGLDIASSLTARNEAAKREKWVHAQYLQAVEVPARPKVNAATRHHSSARRRAHSSGGHRHGSDDEDDLAADVVSRLYESRQKKDAADEASLHSLVDGAVGDTSAYRPAITERAQRLQRKPGHTVGDDLHELGKLKAERQRKIATLKPKGAEPHIDAVSDMIASRLPESSWERLQSSSRSMIRSADGTLVSRNRSAPAGDRGGGGGAFQPKINPLSSRVALKQRRTRSMKFGDKKRNLQSPNPGEDDSDEDEDDHAELLHGDHKRWAQHREQLRVAAEERELSECTFKPQVHSRRPNDRGAAGGSMDDLSASVMGQRYLPRPGSAPALADRMQQWEARRQQRLDAARARAADEEEEGLQGDRSFNDRRGNIAASASKKIPDDPTTRQRQLDRVAHEPTVYGGETRAPWGMDEHIDRQRAARGLKEEQEAVAKKAFATGDKWRNRTTVAEDVRLGPDARRGGHHPSRPRVLSPSSRRGQNRRDNGDHGDDRDPTIDDDLRRHYAGDYSGLGSHVASIGDPNLVAPPDVKASAPTVSSLRMPPSLFDSPPRSHQPPSRPAQEDIPRTTAEEQERSVDVLQRARHALSRAHMASRTV